jgi:hypothetical protein
MTPSGARSGVIDADSHVTEPPDLFTSRVAGQWADVVPRVETHPRTHHSHWRIGDHWVQSVGFFAMAGWNDYPPFSRSSSTRSTRPWPLPVWTKG